MMHLPPHVVPHHDNKFPGDIDYHHRKTVRQFWWGQRYARTLPVVSDRKPCLDHKPPSELQRDLFCRKRLLYSRGFWFDRHYIQKWLKSRHRVCHKVVPYTKNNHRQKSQLLFLLTPFRSLGMRLRNKSTSTEFLN